MGDSRSGKIFSQGSSVSEYDDALQNGLDVSTDDIFQTFVRKAADTGWPQEIIDKISLSLAGGDISLLFDPELEAAIADLEYGVPGSPAKAAIRGFTGDAAEKISEILAEHGLNALFDRGVFS